jgi:hypothetical protein
MPEPGDFVTIEYPDGTTWVDHTRLVNGWVMCCLCFEYKPRSELAPHPELDGCVIDVCQPCAASEAEAVNHRAEEEQRHA